MKIILIIHLFKRKETYLFPLPDKKVITIKYYKMNRDLVKHKIKPLSIMFSEYYFYLIAYKCDEEIPNTPVYFRIDRISEITVHRENYSLPKDSMKGC